jgi:hypothetical protein
LLLFRRRRDFRVFVVVHCRQIDLRPFVGNEENLEHVDGRASVKSGSTANFALMRSNANCCDPFSTDEDQAQAINRTIFLSLLLRLTKVDFLMIGDWKRAAETIEM